VLRDERLLARRQTGTFTLQWHLANACELACKHCYDRTKLAALKLDEALGVLADLAGF
jgi:MoaA/NifB/PqqE/SkfB family radical SAM enzyme